MMEYEEITQETRKDIVLTLQDKEVMGIGETARAVGVSKPTAKRQLENLNDLSVTHKGENGWELISEDVKISRNTDKYIPELLVYLPSTLLFFVFTIYFYLTGFTAFRFALGFFIAFIFPISRTVYKILSEEEYLRVMRKKKDQVQIR